MSLKLIFYFSYSTLCTVKLGNKEQFDKEQIGNSGKSFSEAILTSTNPHYDKRLSIESPVQYMKIPSSEHVVYINKLF